MKGNVKCIEGVIWQDDILFLDLAMTILDCQLLILLALLMQGALYKGWVGLDVVDHTH